MNNDMISNQNQTSADPALASKTLPVAPTKQKKMFVVALIAAVLLLVVLAVLYLVNSSGLFASSDQTATVTINRSGFQPQTIKIKKGQKVEWVNEDTDSHQVASDPFPDHSILPNLYAESPMGKGETFSYTFEEVGTFTYHDQLKPAGLKGTVIVE